MFNLSEIMKAAWRICRSARTFNGVFVFGRTGREAFAKALRRAWQDARVAAGDQTAVARAERAAAIRDQIEGLKYKSFRYDTGAMKMRLETQLAALA